MLLVAVAIGTTSKHLLAYQQSRERERESELISIHPYTHTSDDREHEHGCIWHRAIEHSNEPAKTSRGRSRNTILSRSIAKSSHNIEAAT